MLSPPTARPATPRPPGRIGREDELIARQSRPPGEEPGRPRRDRLVSVPGQHKGVGRMWRRRGGEAEETGDTSGAERPGDTRIGLAPEILRDGRVVGEPVE